MLDGMKTQPSIGANIERMRRALSLSRRQLAARVIVDGRSVSDAAISRYESGERTPKGEYLKALAMALETIPEVLSQPVPELSPGATPDLTNVNQRLDRLEQAIHGPEPTSQSVDSRTAGSTNVSSSTMNTEGTMTHALAFGHVAPLRPHTPDELVAWRATQERAVMSDVVYTALMCEGDWMPRAHPDQLGWLVDTRGQPKDGQRVIVRWRNRIRTGKIVIRAGYRWYEFDGGGGASYGDVEVYPIAAVVCRLMPDK